MWQKTDKNKKDYENKIMLYFTPAKSGLFAALPQVTIREAVPTRFWQNSGQLPFVPLLKIQPESERFDKNIESVNIFCAAISKNKKEGRKERMANKV